MRKAIGRASIGIGALVALSSAWSVSEARAAEGVIEINQAAALAGGVTPGDAPGFPVSLNLPGSYALTGNLTVTAHNTDGVFATGGVDLDLRGFTINGPGSCTNEGASLTCTAVGAGIGLSSGNLARVRGGTIRGFGGSGVSNVLELENVRIEENGAHGALLAPRSRLIEVSVDRNMGHGIFGSRLHVERSSSTGNKQSGIWVSESTITGCSSSGNGAQGLLAGDKSRVQGNVVNNNALDGIVVGAGTLVLDNVAGDNGQAGIAALSSSSVQRNIVWSNGGVGLYLFPEAGGTPATYQGNTVSANGGTVTSGINLGGNSCNGTTTCP